MKKKLSLNKSYIQVSLRILGALIIVLSGCAPVEQNRFIYATTVAPLELTQVSNLEKLTLNLQDLHICRAHWLSILPKVGIH